MESLPDARKKPSKKLNFQNGFHSNYQYSRAVGLWPFQIVLDANGSIEKTRVRLVDILWFFVSISLYLTATFYSFDDINVHIAHDSSAKSYSLFIYYVFQITTLLFGALGIVLDMFNRNKLVDILEKFTAFDNEISKLGIYFNYKYEYRRTWIYLLIPTLFLLLLLLVSNFLYDPNWYKSFDFIRWYSPFFLRSIVWISITISFKTLIRNLYERFAALNSVLRDQFLQSGNNTLKVSAKNDKEDSIEIIKFVGCQHASLTDIMDKLNICYSFQIMIGIGIKFMFMVISLYIYCQCILRNDEFFNIMPWITSGWLVLYSSGILIVIYYASLLTNEGRKTFRIVHDIVNCCRDSDLIQSLGQLSQQTQTRYPIVTCGLFIIDWTLLFNIIAATATYLTIIVNFERVSDKN